MPVDTLMACAGCTPPVSRPKVQVICVSLVLRSTVAVRAIVMVMVVITITNRPSLSDFYLAGAGWNGLDSGHVT